MPPARILNPLPTNFMYRLCSLLRYGADTTFQLRTDSLVIEAGTLVAPRFAIRAAALLSVPGGPVPLGGAPNLGRHRGDAVSSARKLPVADGGVTAAGPTCRQENRRLVKDAGTLCAGSYTAVRSGTDNARALFARADVFNENGSRRGVCEEELDAELPARCSGI